MGRECFVVSWVVCVQVAVTEREQPVEGHNPVFTERVDGFDVRGVCWLVVDGTVRSFVREVVAGCLFCVQVAATG